MCPCRWAGGAFGLADILDSLKNGERLQWPSDGPDRMYDLSMRCWSAEPRDRPTFAQVNDELQILPAILRNTPAEESRGNRRGGGAHGGYESEASYQASAPGGGGGGGGLGARGGHVREEEGESEAGGFRREPATAPTTAIVNGAFDAGASEGGQTRVGANEVAAATSTLQQETPAGLNAAPRRTHTLRDTCATDSSGYTRVSTDQIAAATATLRGFPDEPPDRMGTVGAPPLTTVALQDTQSGDGGGGYTRVSTDQIAAATATLRQETRVSMDSAPPRRHALRDMGAADTSGYTRVSTDQIAAVTVTLREEASRVCVHATGATNDTAV